MKYPKLELIKSELKDGQIREEDIEETLLKNLNEFKLEVREVGELKNRALFLPFMLDWKIVEDSRGEICLVPLKKNNS